MSTKPILMSRDNPDGMKLEELLHQVADELQAKTDAMGESAKKPIGEDVARNNVNIVALLRQAEQLQLHTQRILAELGPDQGPRGKPRI